ncbi:MAG TPA: NAD(P)-dependent oxidoreductase, partial [Burkholderiaceae bacterium]
MNAKPPLRILMSRAALAQIESQLAPTMGTIPFVAVHPDQESPNADIAFVSRDVTGLSTKHAVLPPTQQFYDAMRGSPLLAWVHVHSAGVDRPIFVELMARGVQVSSSSGANAGVVAQTAVAGLLALARCFPQLIAAQREHRWAPLIGSGLPRDLAGQTAIVVGWGAIGQRITALLQMLELHVVVVRRSARPLANDGLETIAFDTLEAALPRADWLLLACPLTDRTRGLVDARVLSLLPQGACLVNVARGEVV